MNYLLNFDLKKLQFQYNQYSDLINTMYGNCEFYLRNLYRSANLCYYPALNEPETNFESRSNLHLVEYAKLCYHPDIRCAIVYVNI